MQKDTHQNKLYWNIEKLRNWDKNPRDVHAEDFERLKEQIKKFGQYKPLLVTQDGEVLGGNMRLRAFNELGVKEIWVSVVSPKDEKEKVEYALSDNDRVGYYVEEQLNKLLTDLKKDYDLSDMSSYKVDFGEAINIDDILRQAEIDDGKDDFEVGGENEKVVSKTGEMYELGVHRLMCGDSTKVEDVKKLMGGSIAKLTFTDPPYNVGLGYNDYNDELSEDEYVQFSKDWFSLAQTFSEKQIVFVGNVNNKMWIKNFEPDYTCIWDKNDGATTHGYITQYTCWEPIFFHGKFERSRHSDMFRFVAGGEGFEHVCPKPIKLLMEVLQNYSAKKDLVLDLFGGSGATLIACEFADRKCNMMEMDPKYCDVIRKRYAKEIGQESMWEESTPVI